MVNRIKLPGGWNGVSKDASKLPVCEGLEGSAPGLAVGGAAGVGVVEAAAVPPEAAQLVSAISGGQGNDDGSG